ncbi:MAG TPA: ATP-binding cassette domain-containing protein [Kofleriaceae bacterium]|nr:ATP-binding cassette domain-containing protein [Kofleriaceae bacterium]
MSNASEHTHDHAHVGHAIALRTKRLVVGHRGRALLPPLDLEVERGHLLLVLGRNGTGKTTLIRTLLGLLPPVSGSIEWTSGAKRAYVAQAGALDASVPVRARDIVRWGGLRGWSFVRPWQRTPAAAVSDGLRALSVEDLAGRQARELSGGQLQRVMFARVLASGADVAILDEPTASMDAAGERAVYATLAKLAHERAFTIVMVTHSVTGALDRCDRVLLLDRDADGTPEVVHGEAAEVVKSDAYQRLFGVSHGA